MVFSDRLADVIELLSRYHWIYTSSLLCSNVFWNKSCWLQRWARL